MKILFVDDEKIIRDGMQAIINWEKIGCQKLVTAENAARALELLENEAFDLVITDIYMQKMTGIELAKKIHDAWPWMRVIILSAYEDFQSIKLIEEHLSQEDFGVNDIAQRLHVSAGYFSRLFKKQMGITCIEYLTQKRIERARKLLERTEMKHQAIAQAVGYASVYYFSLQFKKQTGETPGQYRKRVGKKDDSDD